MKKNGTLKRVATPEEVAKLAQSVQWDDIHLSNGDVVTAETTREIFEDVASTLNSRPKSKRTHAAVP